MPGGQGHEKEQGHENRISRFAANIDRVLPKLNRIGNEQKTSRAAARTKISGAIPLAKKERFR